MDENEQIASLDRKRASRFLTALAEDPFLCIVVTEGEKVSIYSKGISEDHVMRIKQVLKEIEQGE